MAKQPVGAAGRKPSGKDSGAPNPFQTADASGRAVKFRFSSAKALLEVYRRLQEQDLRDSARRARIKMVYDGYLPYDPVMREAGVLKGLSNFNSMGLKGQVDARAAALHDMALDTTNLIELRPLAPEFSGPEAVGIADIVAEEFSVTLRESRRFLPALTAMVREADLFGLGPVTWPDYRDYQPLALERGQLKFPEDASAVSSENDLYMVEATLPAWYLFERVENAEASTAEGWNVPALERYIKAVFSEQKDTTSQTNDTTGTSLAESSVAEWRQNRLYETRQFETVRIVHSFVKEVSEPRKITHYITPTTSDPDDFLFVKPDAYDTMDQCVQWLPYTVGERYARAVRGMASYLLPIEDMRNKFLCQVCDVAFRAASFVLTSDAPGGSAKLTVTEHGPYLVTGAGLTPAQSQVAPNFQQLAAVNEMLSRVSFNSASGASGSAALPERVYSGADRKTKDQVAMEATAGQKVEQSLFILRSTVFDAVFRESFRRFMNLVKDPEYRGKYPGVSDFLARCKRRGVTLGILNKVQTQFQVYMCRDLVTGGASAKAGMLTDMLTTVGGNLDEAGRLAATRDLVLCRMGRVAADRYRPEAGRDTLPSDAASHAVLENNDIRESSDALAAPEQLHWSHIPIHMQVVEGIVQAVQSGQVDDPQRMLDILSRAADHIRAHAGFGGMQIGMDGAAKAVLEQLRALTPVTKALNMMAKAFEKQQAARQEAQAKELEDLRARAEGQEAQVEMHKTDVKAQLAMREQELLQQARLAGVEGKNQVDMLKARSKAALDSITANFNRLMTASKITGGTVPAGAQPTQAPPPGFPLAPSGGI